MNATTNANTGKNAKGALPANQKAILALIHAYIWVKNDLISEEQIKSRIKELIAEDEFLTPVNAVGTYAEELEVDQRYNEILKDKEYDFSVVPELLEPLTLDNADQLIKQSTSLKLGFDDTIVIEVLETPEFTPSRSKYGTQYYTDIKTLAGTYDGGKAVTEGATMRYYLPRAVLDTIIAYCKEKGFKSFKGTYEIVCTKQGNGNRGYTCKALELEDLAELGLLEEPTE